MAKVVEGLGGCGSVCRLTRESRVGKEVARNKWGMRSVGKGDGRRVCDIEGSQQGGREV